MKEFKITYREVGSIDDTYCVHADSIYGAVAYFALMMFNEYDLTDDLYTIINVKQITPRGER